MEEGLIMATLEDLDLEEVSSHIRSDVCNPDIICDLVVDLTLHQSAEDRLWILETLQTILSITDNLKDNKC